VVALEVVAPGGEVVVVTAHGFGKRTPLEEFRTIGRGAQGVMVFPVGEKTGPLVTARVIPSRAEVDLVVVSARGAVLRMTPEEIPLHHRQSRGARVIALEEGDRVASLAAIW
jgi:DNA gyrase subunit A